MFLFVGKEILFKFVSQTISTCTMSLFGSLMELSRIPIDFSLSFGGVSIKEKTRCIGSDGSVFPSQNVKGVSVFEILDFSIKPFLPSKFGVFYKTPLHLDIGRLEGNIYGWKYLRDSLGSGSSFLWISLCWGLEHLNKELVWRIGDGSSINISTYNWIPRPHSLKPLISNNLPNTNVAPLRMDHVIGLYLNFFFFLRIDVQSVLAIHLIFRDGKDSIYWYFDAKGVLSVKSAYKLAWSLQSMADAILQVVVLCGVGFGNLESQINLSTFFGGLVKTYLELVETFLPGV